jgi:hypothetical protein
VQALQSKSSMYRFLGIAGLFSWIAIAIYNVTQDSFATPNVWINLGILAGVTAYAMELKNNDLTPGPATLQGTRPEGRGMQESS